MGVLRVNGPRPKFHEEFRGHGLHIPDGMPLAMTAELHYLYSLLVFSDARPGQLQYTGPTECGRIEYERDGTRWVMVIRKDDAQ